MSYQSNDSAILAQQLKVQELVIRFADIGLYTVATNVISIPVGENVGAIVYAQFLDNSAGTMAPVVAANRSIVSDQVITLDLGAAIAANDVVVVKYIIAE
jgi:hypothetical protein